MHAHAINGVSSRVAASFYARSRTSDSGCWTWHGARTVSGYGYLRGYDNNGSQMKAHRVSYALHKGPIPEGMCVCHHCDNPPCTNPEHLFLGTLADNNRDKNAKGRNVVPLMTQERKEYLSRLYKGRIDSEETKRRKSAAQRGNKKALGFKYDDASLTTRSLSKGGLGQVTYGGVVYATPSHAARAAGVTQQTMTRWLRVFGGNVPLMDEAELYQRRHSLSKPVTLDGVLYRSTSEAARALGCSNWKIARMARFATKEAA